MSAKRVKYLIGGVVIFLAVGFLIYYGTSYAGFYLKPSEVAAKGKTLLGENIRINGKVVKGSISWKPKVPELRFTVTDGKETIPVVYYDIPPDTFKDEADVVVGGVYKGEGTFKADTLLAKCPSRYEAKKGTKKRKSE